MKSFVALYAALAASFSCVAIAAQVNPVANQQATPSGNPSFMQSVPAEILGGQASCSSRSADNVTVDVKNNSTLATTFNLSIVGLSNGLSSTTSVGAMTIAPGATYHFTGTIPNSAWGGSVTAIVGEQAMLKPVAKAIPAPVKACLF